MTLNKTIQMLCARDDIESGKALNLKKNKTFSPLFTRPTNRFAYVNADCRLYPMKATCTSMSEYFTKMHDVHESFSLRSFMPNYTCKWHIHLKIVFEFAITNSIWSHRNGSCKYLQHISCMGGARKLHLASRLLNKRNNWLLADTCPQAANHFALFWVWDCTQVL